MGKRATIITFKLQLNATVVNTLLRCHTTSAVIFKRTTGLVNRTRIRITVEGAWRGNWRVIIAIYPYTSSVRIYRGRQ